MRVNSIYIMLDDGLCIYNQYFTPAAPPKNLVTGMLTAFQSFVHELTGSNPTVLGTGGAHPYTFYFEKRGPITIVLTTSDKVAQPKELSEIGLRFLQRFGEKIDTWKGQDNLFASFADDLTDLLGDRQTAKRVDPKEPLTAFTLLGLDADQTEIAKELIKVKEATSTILAKSLGKEEYPLRLKLEELVELGYVGRYFSHDEYHYFTN